MESTSTISQELFTTNNLWILIAAALVFIMHLGFACVESGFVQKKNVINIIFKNTMIPAIGLLTYALMGFNLMYPGADYAGGFFGFAGFGISTDAAGLTSEYNPGYTYWSDFIFQGMFAATCATIVSGAVAERVKLVPFLIFTTVFVALIYPMIGMWHWGGGWLKEQGFHDFAGSSLVHSVGGWGALAGAIILGPRLGKYVGNTIKPIPGHSIPLATIGVFLLWFGWYGFNGGSVLSADPAIVSLVFVTTSLGAAAGAIVAFLVSYFMFKSYDVSMVLNGILGGLVGITAGADVISPMSSIIIGGIAGALIPISVITFDKLKVDDPVGATSVHLVCGIWGTLAVGIFGDGKSFLPQLIGVAAIGAFAFIAAFALFYILKLTTGIRVTESHEERGLDISEHEMEAYKFI
jgi:ammonium transporter, Amt family